MNEIEEARNNLLKFSKEFSWKLTDFETKKLLTENFNQRNIHENGI